MSTNTTKVGSTLHIVLLVSLLGLSACSTLSVKDDPTTHQASDPLEGLNRSIYGFNRGADKLILRPVARVYNAALPKPAKTGVSNFFANLREPFNIVHNLLQGKPNRALSSTYRFAVNSTVGVLGLIDVANYQGVKPAREDFGQTLAAWGFKPGPYLMLPIMGPTNLRDGAGRLIDTAAYFPINEISDSNGTRAVLTALDVISFRASLLRNDKLLASQVDEYAFLKSAFEQTRINAIYDGNPPEAVEEDFDDF